MQEISVFSSIAERDVDLILFEELTVNDIFSKWFIKSVFGEDAAPSGVKVWHSMTNAGLGESDLIITFYNDGAEKCAILIENKVDAVLQPEQAERYELRGQEGVTKGSWQKFKTCLVSPIAYFETKELSDAFETFISYEILQTQIAELTSDKVRGHFRARMIAEAIEKNRRGYMAQPDAVVTKFWSDYWQLACEFAPTLKMDRPGQKPLNSDWPKFWPVGIPNNSYIVHKMSQGFVDIEIRGGADKIDFIKSSVKGCFDEGVSVKAAGKSAVLRFNVPEVNKLAPIAQQSENIKVALSAALMLLDGIQKSQLK